MKRLYKIISKKSCVAIVGILLSGTLFASQPLKIDLNMSGRSLTEVNEPGYVSWIVNTGDSDTQTFENGVTITLRSAGVGYLKPNWYKAGIGSVKLANDGVMIVDTIEGRDNPAIEMKISGLMDGSHTILTYHNHVDNPATNTFPPIDVYVDGTLAQSNLIPTVRTQNNEDATKFFTTVTAKEGQDVVILFQGQTGTNANKKTVIINAIEIDTRNADMQAKNPSPRDGDEHIDADTGTYTLKWIAADGAVSHNVYFGTNADAVLNATISDKEYKGNQTATAFDVDDLYSMLTYYWRIDEVDSDGNITKGNVWYFRTRQLAFDGAEGYGRFARGGRGGIVVKVTNLNDSGEGSLRDAIDNPKYQGIPRTVIFDVAGRIQLNSRLSVNKPYITIAGQTAPGKGICVSGHAFGIGGVNDVIIRHMRLRVGSEDTTDGMGQSGSNHCIIDHSSISWSKDEATSSRDAHNITFQHCLISEPLNRAGHKNYPIGTAHGYAGSIGGDIGSFHHNLLAHCYGRNWSLAGGLDANGYYKGRLDIFNNVVYNWGTRTTDGGAHEVNFVANYYKPGVETTQMYALNAQWDGFPGSQRYYCNGNIVKGKYEDLSNPRNACRSDSNNPDPWADSPFFPSYATVHTAYEAYKHVLSDVGANQPVFDDHDIRIVKETMDGSWTFRGSYNFPNGTKGVIDHQNDVGGWEDYGTEKRALDYDSDNDGLPDWWENIIGTDPFSPEGDFSDSNNDADRDGFTNLDVFLDWLAKPHYTVNKGNITEVDLRSLSFGFTANPTYSISNSKNCNVSLKNGVVSVTHNQGSDNLGSFNFTVTDSEGASMTRTIGLYLTGAINGIESNQSGDLNVSFINPIRDNLRLSLTTEIADVCKITVLDISGKLIQNINTMHPGGTNTYDVNVSDLSAGVYLLQITIGDKQQVYKFVKR